MENLLFLLLLSVAATIVIVTVRLERNHEPRKLYYSDGEFRPDPRGDGGPTAGSSFADHDDDSGADSGGLDGGGHDGGGSGGGGSGGGGEGS